MLLIFFLCSVIFKKVVSSLCLKENTAYETSCFLQEHPIFHKKYRNIFDFIFSRSILPCVNLESLYERQNSYPGLRVTIEAKIKLIRDADISENQLISHYPEALEQLLRDHTTKRNIFWATDDYEELGVGYSFSDPICSDLITGKNGKVIMPRVKKDKALQTARVREKAEVFTPSWICNKQNNLIDSAWFGRENVFNVEIANGSYHSWKTIEEKIEFPVGKNWLDYVRANRLEITCGEAPYITSRYDTTTGDFIPVESRIGIIDRKLRIVNENTESSGEWLKAAQSAYQSTYGYEWQGDSLLLAREAMLYTFMENYKLKFGKLPIAKSIRYIAYIISWNIWQMDGLKFVVPCSCHDDIQEDLFGCSHVQPCPGCLSGDNALHNGTYCLIKDWSAGSYNRRGIIKFHTLLKGAKV